MMAINTARQIGHALYGMGGSSSLIDYTCFPQRAGVLTQWLQAWCRIESARAFFRTSWITCPGRCNYAPWRQSTKCPCVNAGTDLDCRGVGRFEERR
eukprot:2433232-Pyramimonas_sp.AAC.1